MRTAKTNQRELAIGHFRRRLRESVLAYLLVAPAFIITLIFGIYPVITATWESLKFGRPITNSYVGLDNYVKGIGGLIYIVLMLLAVAFCYLASKAWRRAREHHQQHPSDNLLLYLVTSLVLALGLIWLIFLGITEYFKFGPLLVGFILVVISVGSYTFLRRRTEGNYIGNTLLLMVLTVLAVLIVRYAYGQMEQDVAESREVAHRLFNTNVANAVPDLPIEGARLVNVSLDGDVPLMATIGDTTYDAFLSPQAYQNVAVDSFTDSDITFVNNQKVQVLLPLAVGLGFQPAPYTTEAIVQLKTNNLLGTTENLNATILLSENTEVLAPFDLYQAQDVGLAVVTRGGYTPPISRPLTLALAVAVGIGLIFLIGSYREKMTEDSPLYGWSGLLRVILALAVLGLFMYLLMTIQLYRETAHGLESLSDQQFSAAYEYATGAPPRATLRAQDLAAELLFAPQLILIGIGMFLIGIAYIVWAGAQKRATNLGLSGMFFLALLLMVGGWLCISELPGTVMRAGAPALEVRDALVRTVIYSMVSVPAQLVFGLLLAYLMFYEVRLGKGMFRLIYFMPYIAPQIATATVFTVIFSLDPGGLANKFLGLFGIEAQKWLLEPNGLIRVIFKEIFHGDPNKIPSSFEGPSMALTTVIMFNIWVYSGYYAVIFLAGLGSIPGELYEAAKVDGAGRWSAFRNITIPLLSPVTFFLSLLGIIGTFSSFQSIYVMRSGAIGQEVDTLTIRIFEVFYKQNDPGYATALAFILFMVILILTLIQNQLSKDRVFYG
ncbi:MAG: sugar ABC transporter permease [Chloroflexi bacterium]|nr:sugar ABC transporter permease [Chloroflexota bacterium]